MAFIVFHPLPVSPASSPDYSGCAVCLVGYECLNGWWCTEGAYIYTIILSKLFMFDNIIIYVCAMNYSHCWKKWSTLVDKIIHVCG